MWFPLIGLLIGIVLGLSLSVTIPPDLARYTAVAVLASLDSLVGAARATLEGTYSNRVFLSGLIVNSLLAFVLTLIGDRLGSDLYLAAVVAFGVRLFTNLSLIRQKLL